MRILKAKEPPARPGRIESLQEGTATLAGNTQKGVQEVQQGTESAESAAGLAGTLANHKGKLAVGAAAMLGLAVFYKWREHKLAKDDPEEYARLRRLKAAVDTEEG